ncbi:MAG: hypothetical protein K0R52_432 [Alphaproteobacteria bacterium]|jgi:hypothetical protein|nr:hypothetical protein [Alphaproteobacteria bacterium]
MTAKNTSPTPKLLTRRALGHRLTQVTEKMTALQREQDEICQDLSQNISRELTQCLVDAKALDIEFNILMGGILEVVSQAKADTSKAEAWRKSGQTFHERRNRIDRSKRAENGQFRELQKPH